MRLLVLDSDMTILRTSFDETCPAVFSINFLRLFARRNVRD